MKKTKKTTIGDYPEHLKGLGTNRYGGNQLQRERGLKGGTYGPANAGRTYSKEEREAFICEQLGVDPDAKGRGNHIKLHSRLNWEARFQQHVLRLLQEATKLTKDALGEVRNLIEDLGAVEVAKMLVDPTDVSDPPAGFLRLMENNLARLTIEQAMIDFADSGLFEVEEIEAARARLANFTPRKSSR
jgi:hypothetical protein